MSKRPTLKTSVIRLLEINAAVIDGTAYRFDSLMRHIGDRYTYEDALVAINQATSLTPSLQSIRNWKKQWDETQQEEDTQ